VWSGTSEQILTSTFSILGDQLVWLIADDEGRIVTDQEEIRKVPSESLSAQRASGESRRWQVSDWKARSAVGVRRQPGENQEEKPNQERQEDNEAPSIVVLCHYRQGVAFPSSDIRPWHWAAVWISANLSLAFFAGRFVFDRRHPTARAPMAVAPV